MYLEALSFDGVRHFSALLFVTMVNSDIKCRLKHNIKEISV
jgi:hypothetical protein